MLAATTPTIITNDILKEQICEFADMVQHYNPILSQKFKRLRQEDAHEFITYTLDDIMEHMVNKKAFERYISVQIDQHAHYKLNQSSDSNKTINETILSFRTSFK